MFYSRSTGGFYNLAIHGDTIPADKIEIDADLYQSLMGSLAQGARIEIGADGLPIAVYPAPPTAEEELAAAKAAGSAEMLAWITGFLGQFTAGVPDDEVKSWPRKAEAARAYLAGQPAPMILVEAEITGENRTILSQTIAAKASAYEAIISTTTGLRRKTEAGIAAATSPDQVQAVLIAAKTTAAKLAASLGVHTPKGA
jgi:hypothetical protein